MNARQKTLKVLLALSEAALLIIAITSLARSLAAASALWALAGVGALFACAALALGSRLLEQPLGQAQAQSRADETDMVHEASPRARAAAASAAGNTDDSEDMNERFDIKDNGDENEDGAAMAPAAADGAMSSSPSADDGESAIEKAQPDVSEEPARRTSQLDYDSLVSTLLATADPMAELKLFVGDIRTRQAETADDVLAPSELELFCARQLEEAGLFENDVELPQIKVVIPRLSQMLYLRTTGDMTYLAKLRIIRLEAALNAIRFANNYFDDHASVTMEDCYRMLQNLTQSVCAQVPAMSMPSELQDGDIRDGEWSVRRGISEAIEGFTLPYRLTADFRTNVADGNVAIRLNLIPEQCFPKSMLVEGLGIVASSREMRHKAASAYALRLGLLVANEAFRTSEKIKHVWVQGMVETASRTRCYYCVDFDRWRFSRLDLQHADDLVRIYRSFVPQMRYEDGILRPVQQTFSLDEERFCPGWRYMPVSLSRRKLAEPQAEALGTDHVSGLAIEEADKRSLIASDIMRGLEGPNAQDATEHNVKTIMEAAGDDPDPSVRAAAERTVRRLIDGSLPDDVLSISEEFVSGDDLTRAVTRAHDQLAQHDPAAAERTLHAVLDPLDASELYKDSGLVEWRYFNNYLDRALYNRRLGKGKTVMLVPDAYYNAEMLLSMAQLAQKENEAALATARRVLAMAPLDTRASLQVARCLEMLDRTDESIAELKRLLENAHDPEAVGLAYYRLAYFEWHKNNLLAAQACYQCAAHFLPQGMPQISMELTALALQNMGTVKQDITSDEIVEILKDHDIPVAPTEQMTQAFYDAARASVDAEVFPVARNFVNVLGAFTGDDVVFGIIRSLEDEPDR